MRRSSVVALLVTAIAFFLAAVPRAAAAESTVTGTVADQLGGAVAHATVSLVRDGRTVEATTTDDRGQFTFAVTEAGRYELVADAPGFLTRRVASFFVAAGARVPVAVTLSIGITQAETVTASATEVPVSQAASPVTVIDRATIDAIGKPSVVEALRLVPGVHIVQAGGRGASASLFVRGGASYFNKVLIDGVPANDIGGAFDYADLATAGVDRVEVLRAANSVLYGSDALAGVVSITTRRGTTRVPELRYAIDGGNFGTSSHQLSLGGADGRADYFVSFSNFDTDNDVANDAYRNRQFAGRLGWTAGTTDLSAVYREGSARTGLPGTVAFYGLSDDSRKDADTRLFSASAESRISPRFETVLRLAILTSNYHTLNPAPTGEPYDPFGFGPNYLGNPVTIAGANGYQASGRAILDYAGVYPALYDAATTRQLVFGQATWRASDMFRLSAGLRAEHEEGTTEYTGGSVSATRRNNSGAFLEAQAMTRRVAANAGIGFDDNAISGFTATPRISVALYLRDPSATASVGDTKLTVNAGTGVKAPSIGQELSSLYSLVHGSVSGVTPIAPEKSRSVDAGIEQAFWRGRLRVRASYFNNDFTNVIEFVNKAALTSVGVTPEAAEASGFGAYVNSSSYTAQGVEVSAEASVRRVRVSASYTFLDADVTRSFSGDVLAPAENPAIPGIQIGAFSPLLGARPFRRPAEVATFLAGYAGGRLDLTLVGYMSSAQDDSTFLSDPDFGNTLLLPNHDLLAGYTKVDLSAGYCFATSLRWYMTVENLLDRDYQAAAGFPALPRSVRTGLTISVGGR
jgi:iron complex outermembrane receptor protein/vitamin B12 transporter